jgi:predicted DNA-binding transcriptional regulator AlpA
MSSTVSDLIRDRRVTRDRRRAERRNKEAVKPSAALVPAAPGLESLELHTGRLWTVHEAAAFLRRSTSWVYKAVERGELPRAKGMAWGVRFVASDLMSYARGEMRSSATPASLRDERT